MTHFEKFQSILTEMGVPFELTDDSEEYPLEDIMEDHGGKLNTAVVIGEEGDDNAPVVFLFHKDGSFKEVVVF